MKKLVKLIFSPQGMISKKEYGLGLLVVACFFILIELFSEGFTVTNFSENNIHFIFTSVLILKIISIFYFMAVLMTKQSRAVGYDWGYGVVSAILGALIPAIGTVICWGYALFLWTRPCKNSS